MTKPLSILIASAMTLAISTAAQVGAIDPNRPGNEQEHETKQKYTCPMHPEVVTDHPGNCPKCGMKLVPGDEEKKRPTQNSDKPRAGAQHSTSDHSRHQSYQTHDSSGTAMPHHDNSATVMHPPSHESHEMHMEMRSTIDLADPMNREGSGTSWLPDSSPMYGKMFTLGEDMLMLHGAIFPRYTNVSTR